MAAKKPAEPHGDFDAEVDSARRRLEASLKEHDGEFDDLAALQALAPVLEEKIKSRRLAFTLAGEDDDDETSIAVIHVDTDEELGFIFAESGEYVFESNLDAYFDDFVDEDAERFVERLYETLRADLPKYEVENKGG